MSIWGPVAQASTPPTPWVVEGAQASCATVDDFILEFGDSYAMSQKLLDLATSKVEDRLGRPLRNAIYTDRLRIVYDGYTDLIFGVAGAVRPRAIPVQRVISPGGVQILDQGVELRYVPPDDTMLSFFGESWIEEWATITYQGGYTPDMLPTTVKTIIFKIAIRMLQRQTPGSMMDVAVPGVDNPHAGDVSYSTGPQFGSLFDPDDLKELRRYRYRGSF